MKFYDVVYRTQKNPSEHAVRVLSDLAIKISMFGDACDPSFIEANNKFQSLYHKLSVLLNSEVKNQEDKTKKCMDFIELKAEFKSLFAKLKLGMYNNRVIH